MAKKRKVVKKKVKGKKHKFVLTPVSSRFKEDWYVRSKRSGVITGPFPDNDTATRLSSPGDLIFDDSIFREKGESDGQK